MPEDKQPHDSAAVYSGTRGNHWFRLGSKIAQSERPDRSRAQWILLALLIIFAVIGGSFLGFILETQVFNPPTQVVGVCPPPAFISGNDCLTKTCTTNTSGGEVCNNQEAGYIIGSNGQHIVCNNGVCVSTG